MKSARIIFFTWLAWCLILLSFQAWVSARVELRFPDRALFWTTFETGVGYQQNQPYLLEPFMNDQVAWDSEYYLAIAVGGYDDPATDLVGPPGKQVTKSYAFFPFYPLMMRGAMVPLNALGMSPIATATLAGVLISALGALAGMWGLFDLSRPSLGEEGALRASFYLIIFPTGFFLLQVYTEGLFAGLAFVSLALMKRKQWVAAAILASCATLTRPLGIALLVPLLMTWFRSGDWMDVDLEWRQIIVQGVPWRALGQTLMIFSPLVTLLVWKFSMYGLAFDFVQANFFGRGFLALGASYRDWTDVWRSMLEGENLQHTAYYLTEFFGITLGALACIVTFKQHPEIAWCSIVIFIISLGSGSAQGMHRYILNMPALFLALARWGAYPVFDRAWTIVSILWMGALATLFTFNMWVA
jgi:Gpi18-like mannosyltransferase